MGRSGECVLPTSLFLFEDEGRYSASRTASVRPIEICAYTSGLSRGVWVNLHRTYACADCALSLAGGTLEQLIARIPQNSGRGFVVLSGGLLYALTLDAESVEPTVAAYPYLFYIYRNSIPDSRL